VRIVPPAPPAPAKLELGHVDSAAYIACLQPRPGGMFTASSANTSSFPPTVFPSGFIVAGNERQASLGMTDRAALLREMRDGTS